MSDCSITIPISVFLIRKMSYLSKHISPENNQLNIFLLLNIQSTREIGNLIGLLLSCFTLQSIISVFLWKYSHIQVWYMRILCFKVKTEGYIFRSLHSQCFKMRGIYLYYFLCIILKLKKKREHKKLMTWQRCDMLNLANVYNSLVLPLIYVKT